MIELPIPLTYKGQEYHEVEIGDVTAGLLADVQKIVESGDTYKALACFCAGIILQIDSETDRAAIKSMVNYMPYKALEYVVVKGLLKNDKDDGVEGYYECPRCGTPKTCEYNAEDKLDTRDHINDLEVLTTDKTKFSIDLKHPIEIKNGEEIIDIVKSLEMNYPTVTDCSNALNKVGLKDPVRMQLAILIEALTNINGKEIDNRWKSNYGAYVFNHLEKDDIVQINTEASLYGYNPVVKKHCLKCGKDFNITLNTSNFFGSALGA